MDSPSSQLDFVAPESCRKCARLATFIDSHRVAYPDWHNGPVPSFGPIEASILILGLAPGLRGANATGRPFTGDFAGKVLYDALTKIGLASGNYAAHANDGLVLRHVRIANAVRCVPPQNKPVAAEIAMCRPYLSPEIAAMTGLKAIFVLGRIAHETVLRHFGLKLADYPFSHDQALELPNGLQLISSYHCSRYNVQTNRLTTQMFDKVCARLTAFS
ncbi:MAG: uracil-DNA glycosylase [Candidatus Puniceispirillaceae bacterium]